MGLKGWVCSARVVVVIRMGNTRILYGYRDASNYKTYPEEDVIVSGELAWADFEPVLHMGEMFIPSEIGLPDLQSQLENFPTEDDHIWHELIDLEPTEKDPTVEVAANEINARLQSIGDSGWDEAAAIKKLEALK